MSSHGAVVGELFFTNLTRFRIFEYLDPVVDSLVGNPVLESGRLNGVLNGKQGHLLLKAVPLRVLSHRNIL